MMVEGKKGMRGDSIAEVPVQKSKTEIEKLPKGVYRVISQLPFRRSNKTLAIPEDITTSHLVV
jgi:hypothetical protein